MKKIKIVLAVLLTVLLIINMTGCSLMNQLDERMHPSAESEESQEDEASAEKTAEESRTESAAQSSAAEESSKQEESSKGEESSKEESSKAEESSKEESSEPEESKDESSQPEESEESKAETPAPLSGQYSGEFSSDTETALNVVVKWAATQNQDTFYTISVQFYLECYSLEVGPRYDNVMTVKTSKQEKEYYFDTGDITKEEDEFSEIYMGKTSFSVPESEFKNGVEVTVEWPLWGTYSDKEIKIVKAEGVIRPN